MRYRAIYLAEIRVPTHEGDAVGSNVTCHSPVWYAAVALLQCMESCGGQLQVSVMVS